jgi:hypothetical protein
MSGDQRLGCEHPYRELLGHLFKLSLLFRLQFYRTLLHVARRWPSEPVRCCIVTCCDIPLQPCFASEARGKATAAWLARSYAVLLQLVLRPVPKSSTLNTRLSRAPILVRRARVPVGFEFGNVGYHRGSYYGCNAAHMVNECCTPTGRVRKLTKVRYFSFRTVSCFALSLSEAGAPGAEGTWSSSAVAGVLSCHCCSSL